jgi:hypothetical protein
LENGSSVTKAIGCFDQVRAKGYDVITLLSWRKSGVFEADNVVVAIARYRSSTHPTRRPFSKQFP